MADLGTNYIYKLENLSTNLKIQTLEKVMEALEVDLDTFFDIQLKEEDPKISLLVDELKTLPTEQRFPSLRCLDTHSQRSQITDVLICFFIIAIIRFPIIF